MLVNWLGVSACIVTFRKFSWFHLQYTCLNRQGVFYCGHFEECINPIARLAEYWTIRCCKFKHPKFRCFWSPGEWLSCLSRPCGEPLACWLTTPVLYCCVDHCPLLLYVSITINITNTVLSNHLIGYHNSILFHHSYKFVWFLFNVLYNCLLADWLLCFCLLLGGYHH